MAKLALLIVAFAALIHSSVPIKCYNCKEKNVRSTVPQGANLPLCDPDDLHKSPTLTNPELNCKKLVERVKEGGKEVTNVLRFPGPKTMSDLDVDSITEYTCNVDLCNEAASVGMSILLLLLSLSSLFLGF